MVFAFHEVLSLCVLSAIICYMYSWLVRLTFKIQKDGNQYMWLDCLTAKALSMVYRSEWHRR